MRSDVVILGAARTPIGRFGGTLRDLHPAALGATAAHAALQQAGLDPADIEQVIFGHARQAGCGPNPARQVGRRAGVPDTSPAETVNKACASGMQAIASGAQMILLGDADVVLAGGMESMSRVPYLLDAADARWGHRMGNVALVDAMYRDGFSCPLSGLLMGETAEVLARQYGITREESDAYACASQQRAEAATRAGYFTRETAPVEVTASGSPAKSAAPGAVATLDVDEHPRFGTTIEALRKLPPAFPAVDGQPGIITAGSSAGITDGGAAIVLASAAWAARRGIVPRARVAGWASAGVDPRIMGIGPVPAIKKLEQTRGIRLDDQELIEINEAFAPQVLAVMQALSIPADRVNVNGGAIALGHPIGCSGARIVVTLLHEMERRQVRRGLAALCVSGGMGMAMAIECA